MSLDAADLPVTNSQKKPGANGQIPDTIQVVEFLLGNEHYAINLFEVREVVEYTAITRLPDTPQFIRGIIDLRGEITTILDLGERLNISAKGQNPERESGRIIVLDEKLTGAKTGILVDDVLSVSTFDRTDVDGTSAGIYNEDSAIMGIIRKKVRSHDREITDLIIWIGLGRILNEAKIGG